MLIESTKRNGFQILRVNDPVNLRSDLGDLRKAVEEYVGQGVVNIALAFSKDSYFYTKHISILVQCLEMLKDANGTLAMIDPNEEILDVLRTIGFFDFTKIYANDDEVGLEK
jgi:anti-anti-sigma regulatory factor